MMHLGLKEAVDTVYRRTVLGWGEVVSIKFLFLDY
jgi:hypothetical protein